MALKWHYIIWLTKLIVFWSFDMVFSSFDYDRMQFKSSMVVLDSKDLLICLEIGSLGMIGSI
jgi:hypothetical protein